MFVVRRKEDGLFVGRKGWTNDPNKIRLFRRRCDGKQCNDTSVWYHRDKLPNIPRPVYPNVRHHRSPEEHALVQAYYKACRERENELAKARRRIWDELYELVPVKMQMEIG